MPTLNNWFRCGLAVTVLGTALGAGATTPAVQALPAQTGKLAVPHSMPLKGPLKLVLPATAVPAMPARNALDQAYENFKRIHGDALTARGSYMAKRDECAARSFSVQDQQQAACQATDTVAQCNEKLEQWCVGNASRPYRRANRALLRASMRLKSEIDKYNEQVRLLPEGD